MIAIIRIHGRVGLRKDIVETLNRLRLGKKYTCVVLKGTKEELGMIQKVKNVVAFGEIDDKTYKELVEKRGKKDNEGKLKPYFRLHPPRKGIKSKKDFGDGKGVLGNHKKEINKLIERML